MKREQDNSRCSGTLLDKIGAFVGLESRSRRAHRNDSRGIKGSFNIWRHPVDTTRTKISQDRDFPGTETSPPGTQQDPKVDLNFGELGFRRSKSRLMRLTPPDVTPDCLNTLISDDSAHGIRT